jgi:Leucine-rich repeat (LRR) protein
MGGHSSLHHHHNNHHHHHPHHHGHHSVHHTGHHHTSYSGHHNSGHNGLNSNGNGSTGLNGSNLSSKMYSSNGSSGSLIAQSTSNMPLTQQQIMMQSPSVNMAAVAAYGQQPVLLANSSLNQSVMNGSLSNNNEKSILNNNSNNNNNNSSNNQNQNGDDGSSYGSYQKNNHIQSIPWYEVEIKGMVKNLSPKLWQWTHLRCLYLNDNNLMRLPPVLASLEHLQCLDASNNKIRALPAEIGDMTSLRDLYLNNNQIRVLPFELGKLFKLQHLGIYQSYVINGEKINFFSLFLKGLKGNPLTQDVNAIYCEPNGTQKLLIHLLDHLTSNYKIK